VCFDKSDHLVPVYHHKIAECHWSFLLRGLFGLKRLPRTLIALAALLFCKNKRETAAFNGDNGDIGAKVVDGDAANRGEIRCECELLLLLFCATAAAAAAAVNSLRLLTTADVFRNSFSLNLARNSLVSEIFISTSDDPFLPWPVKLKPCSVIRLDISC
ncbi:hypothetical protein DERP_008077, partial [Dermatophagoides pteronyssinus]